MTTMNKFVIYAITPNDDVDFVIKDCKRPAACKEYKQYEKDFELDKYDEFGFVTLLEVLKQDYWLTTGVRLKKEDVKKYLK